MARRRAGARCDVAAERLGAEMFELPFGRARLDPWPHVPRDGTGSGTVGLVDPQPASRPSVHGALAGRHACSATTRPSAAACTSSSTSTATAVDLVGVHLTSRLPYGPPIQLRRLARAAAAAGAPGDRRRRLQLLGSRRRGVPPRAGSARCAGAPGRRSRPHSQIDHILVRDGVGTRIDVAATTRCSPDVGSDHRPVRAHAGCSERRRAESSAR